MYSLILLSIFAWLLIFKIDRGSNVPYKSRGGSKKSEAPAAVANPTQQAADINAAQSQYDPLAAQRAYQIYTNPEYGAGAMTRYNEQQRSDIFPNETAARNQLVQNILGQLQSPTGITPDQQGAITARRGEAQTNLVQALRDRANLGGTLYGGRSALDEGEQVGNLQNIFAEEDINREERARQQAVSNAIPLLQLLYPDVNITAPQYQSPVQDPGTYASSLLSQRGQDMQYQQAQDANKNALYSALFQGLGTAAGGALSGGTSLAAPAMSQAAQRANTSGLTFRYA